MPDKHLPYNYPTPVSLHPVLGSFLCARTQLTVAAMQPNGLACRNNTGDHVNLHVCWGVRLS
jgi:hypothetical protein